MTDYTQVVAYGPKDSLTTGDPNKKILGTQLDGEFSLIATAITSKLNSSTYTASDILTKLLTVDGSGSTLDADTIDGLDSTTIQSVPQNAQTVNYTLVIGDAGKHIFHASGAGAGDTYTIPANASVAFPIGTVIGFVNYDSNSVSIAITTDQLVRAGTSDVGTRTLAQFGWATAMKVTSTSWIISGTGLT